MRIVDLAATVLALATLSCTTTTGTLNVLDAKTDKAHPATYLGLPLRSGQLVITEAPGAYSFVFALIPEHYHPFTHAAIISMEGGLPYVYDISGRYKPMFHSRVLDNVKVSLESKTALPSRFWLSGRATNVLDTRARELLADVGLDRERDLLAAQLSYGRKRALELAISLAQDPKILLLDEPTAGMGTEDVGRIAQLIARVKADRTIVLVEHNLSVVADLSDRITVLQRGRVLVEGSYAEVRADQRVIDAYLGGGAGVHA